MQFFIDNNESNSISCDELKLNLPLYKNPVNDELIMYEEKKIMEIQA